MRLSAGFPTRLEKRIALGTIVAAVRIVETKGVNRNRVCCEPDDCGCVGTVPRRADRVDSPRAIVRADNTHVCGRARRLGHALNFAIKTHKHTSTKSGITHNKHRRLSIPSLIVDLTLVHCFLSVDRTKKESIPTLGCPVKRPPCCPPSRKCAWKKPTTNHAMVVVVAGYVRPIIDDDGPGVVVKKLFFASTHSYIRSLFSRFRSGRYSLFEIT
jgi:hypothetical protein